MSMFLGKAHAVPLLFLLLYHSPGWLAGRHFFFIKLLSSVRRTEHHYILCVAAAFLLARPILLFVLYVHNHECIPRIESKWSDASSVKNYTNSSATQSHLKKKKIMNAYKRPRGRCDEKEKRDRNRLLNRPTNSLHYVVLVPQWLLLRMIFSHSYIVRIKGDFMTPLLLHLGQKRMNLIHSRCRWKERQESRMNIKLVIIFDSKSLLHN